MDLKVLKSRSIGIFAKKIYIGRFFSDLSKEDFATEQEYFAHLDSIDKDEYVYMREPTTEEAKQLGSPALDDAIVARLPPEKQIDYYEKKNKENMGSSDAVMALARKCIVSSSIKNGEQPADVKEVQELVFSSQNLAGYIMREWMAGSAVFPKKSDEA